MNQFDVLSYLDSIGISPEYRSQRRYIYIPCPICDNRDPHLWINVGDPKRPYGIWKCWHDEENHRGGPVKLIRHLENVSWKIAFARLEEFSKTTTEEEVVVRREPEFPEIEMPDNLTKAVNSKRAMGFLKGRGFGVQEAIDWGLYYGDYWRYRYEENGRSKYRTYRWSLFIPVRFQGRLVAFQARDITGRRRQKYLSSPNSPIKDILYNADRVDSKLVVVGEGVTDCWAVGKKHGACLFGKKISPYQARILYEVVGAERVLVALDGEAYAEAEGIAQDLVGVVPRVDVLELPHGEDPASLGGEKLWDLINFIKIRRVDCGKEGR